MVKPKFLLVTDNTSFEIAGSRYLGPYRIAHELEKAGIHTIVLDRFYSFTDFFTWVENLLDDSFIGIGFSTTFMTPPTARAKVKRYGSRPDKMRHYNQSAIVHENFQEACDWFTELKKIVTKKAPQAKIFLGGAKAHAFLREPFNSLPGIDFLVMGVVDHVFPKVVSDLLSGQTIHAKVVGRMTVIDTMTHYVQPKVCSQHDWLNHWFIQTGEALPLEISRGCAFNCKFCNYDKRDSIKKSLEDLKTELVRNYENYGTRFYHFADDCFNDSRKKVEDVCNLILSLDFKIEWVTYARFDVAVKFPETADLMVQAGGRGFHWGVESLTAEVARRAGKGTSPEKIKEFITSFYKNYGSVCYSTGSFISGLPGETKETWNQQIDWLVNSDNFHFVQIGPLAIRPFKSEFDGSVIDYADYSRNPQKYGFSEISHSPEYWKHETMDYIEAESLAREAMLRWEKKMVGRNGVVTDIWVYPQLRSLGLDEKEVYDCFFSQDPEVIAKFRTKGQKVHDERSSNYFTQLRLLAGKKEDGNTFKS